MHISASIPLPGTIPARAAAGRLGRILGATVALLRHWRRERETFAAFERLDAATLRDIGMTQWEMRRQMQAERDALLRRVRQAGA